MITAAVWILLNMILVVLYNRGTARPGMSARHGRRKSASAKEVPPTAAGRDEQGPGVLDPAADEPRRASRAGHRRHPAATVPRPRRPSAPVRADAGRCRRRPARSAIAVSSSTPIPDP